MNKNESANLSKLSNYGFFGDAAISYIYYKILRDEKTMEYFGNNEKPLHFALFNKIKYEKVLYNPITSRSNGYAFKFNLADSINKFKKFNDKNSFLLFRNQFLHLQNIAKIYYSWDDKGEIENSVKFVGYLKSEVFEKFKKSFEKSVRSEFGN